jgi:glutamate-5-semialdehyde dehydrogenase
MKIKYKEIERLCRAARDASRVMALVDSRTKAAALSAMAKALEKARLRILKANALDLKMAEETGLSGAMIDRLTLSRSRIKSMAGSLAVIAALKDPVGGTIETVKRPNGLVIKKVRVPIGVILIIYESRPNVTSDCAGLCLKSGNSVILRGGKEALNSNIAIYDVLKAQARPRGIPEGAIQMVRSPDRGIVSGLLRQSGLIDLVMPRGGESLIKEVTAVSRIPVIKHYKGVCHTFVDRSADLEMAQAICFNAKVQRPGVCNAMETMLVHADIADKFLPEMIRRFMEAGVEIRGCPRTRRICAGVRPAAESDWYEEYLDLILAVRVVADAGEAIRHITKYGSSHSDAIITRDKKAASRFLREVDSACVYVNASTRFTDGGEFGKGAEIGISTDRIHARGPMGPEELTSYKYLIYGSGQVRG